MTQTFWEGNARARTRQPSEGGVAGTSPPMPSLPQKEGIGKDNNNNNSNTDHEKV